MARPKKPIVDYFPHDTDASEHRVESVLQNKYGNDGYAFWYRLKELLGRSPGHFYDFKDGDDWEFLLAKTHISVPETARRILETLAILHAIDPELYQEGILWAQELVDSVEDVYKKRGHPKPERPVFGEKTPVSASESEVSGDENPQSKLKETKVEETKGKQINGVRPSASINNKDKDEDLEYEVNRVMGTLKKENIGGAAPPTRSEVEVAVLRYGSNRVIDAITEARVHNKGTWVYVQGILQNWEHEGKPAAVRR
jgi:hypothetical protein